MTYQQGVARTPEPEPVQEKQNDSDCVDLASEQSFPASDAPAWIFRDNRQHGSLAENRGGEICEACLFVDLGKYAGLRLERSLGACVGDPEREMSDFKAGAESIFDEEEPVGRPTDAFPGERP